MSFNKKVVKLLKEKKKTKAQLAKAAGTPYTTLDSMLKRDSDATRLETMFRIADYLGVSVEELVFEDYSRTPRNNELSESERALIDCYRSIDERGRSTVSAVASFEASRSRSQIIKPLRDPMTKRIPVYLSPAAAGEPLPILADDYSLVNASDAPEEASFGIRISGDSMEPLIADASLVWVKKQQSLDKGDIGIFVLNGESLCKKLDYIGGECCLVSINSKYKPIRIFESDNLKVIGRVIL